MFKRRMFKIINVLYLPNIKIYSTRIAIPYLYLIILLHRHVSIKYKYPTILVFSNLLKQSL